MKQGFKTYQSDDNRTVWACLPHGRRYPLNPRFDLVRHSPDGFNWGYGGAAAAQLSIALLADALADRDRALHLYQDFKWKVVSRLPMDGNWRLTQTDIFRVCDKLEKNAAKVSP